MFPSISAKILEYTKYDRTEQRFKNINPEIYAMHKGVRLLVSRAKAL